METRNMSSRPRPLVTQVQNNTTLWIGHLRADPTDHFAGQTFKCPSSGDLDNIQVFSAAVQGPGQLTLSLHSFDPETKFWGPVLASAAIEVDRVDRERWLRFDLPPMPLQQGEMYGFRVYANNTMIALGEAAAGNQNPFNGEEWHADSIDQTGHYYRYFSLAYKIEMCG